MNDNPIQPLPGGDYHEAAPADHHRHEDPFEIFRRIHRLLRGRYPYAIALAVVGAAAGALLGWYATVPKYTSVGMIRIKLNTQGKVYQIDDNRIQVNPFARSQANLLQEPRVIDGALASNDWKATGRGSDPEAKEKFRDSLRVVTEYDQPEWIYVRFTDTSPKIAKIAVEQVINAYNRIYGENENIATPGLLTDLSQRIQAKQFAINKLDADLFEVSKQFGTLDLEIPHRNALERVQELSRSCDQIGLRIKQAEAASGGSPNDVPVLPEVDPETVARAIAKSDDTMKQLLARRDAARVQLDDLLAQGLTERHRSVERASKSYEMAKSAVELHRTQWLTQNPGVALPQEDPTAAAAPLSDEGIAQLRRVLKVMEEDRDAAHELTQQLNQARLRIASIREQTKKTQEQLADIERRYTVLTTESGTDVNSKRIIIVSDGDEPVRPSSDQRLKLAVFGTVLGGGIPFAFALGLGLFDRRYRYSDDASSGRLQPALLGILPYLPANINDPEQAAVAAHCVHQIRTLLQISVAQQNRHVFAVTSPTSGDGKTSLTLSLALSFASSGANTCMIDFDMIGGGLTSAMGAKTDKGLFDAIDHGELNGHIRGTAFKKLSIIPIGRNDASEVSRLSPELVRRVIEQAREKFDVVVIDTGPILGSIEASLVSTVADGIILAVGRGQSRATVQKAMEHLSGVGARVMGFVFNRAEPGDFRRAVSSASVRSTPAQAGPADALTRFRALPSFGPMADTVASQADASEDSRDAR
jgi:capsular exopolysaccharide synthesis family protein